MITNAVGVPDIKTNGNAVQTVFSKKFNARYWQTSSLVDTTTSEFFPEANAGDKVTITSEPTITFHTDYKNGQDLGAAERINLSSTDVVFDQAGYANVALTDVDKNLSHLQLEAKYGEVSRKEADKAIETAYFAAMVDAAATGNKGATAGVKSSSYDLGTSGAGVAVNSSNIVRFVTRLQAVLAEQVASGGLAYAYIPVWMQYLLVNSDLKNAMIMGDATSALRTGYIGELWKMKFFVNTYLSGAGNAAATPTAILAGVKQAVCFTARLVTAEKYRDGNFQTLLQLLMIWGWKAIKPEGIVNAYAYMAAEA